MWYNVGEQKDVREGVRVSIMEKRTALNILFRCAKKYDENLKGQNFLFVYQNKDKMFQYHEMVFEDRHFYHLTGVAVNPNSEIKNSFDFYQACLHQTLKEEDILFRDHNVTVNKLNVLKHLPSIYKQPTYIGKFNHNSNFLETQRVLGNQTFCLGCVCQDIRYYCPNSLLKKNVKKVTNFRSGGVTIAVFSKLIYEKKYSKMRYVSRNWDLNDMLEQFPYFIQKRIANELEITMPKPKIEGLAPIEKMVDEAEVIRMKRETERQKWVSSGRPSRSIAVQRRGYDDFTMR